MVLGWAGPSAAADGDGLELKIKADAAQSNPVKLTFAVTNTSAAACGVSTAAEGTVRVLSVRKDGQELVPTLGRSFYEDGIGDEIAARLVKAEPKSTVDVPILAVRIHDGDAPGSIVLRSVAATPEGGGLDSLWPVGAKGKYEVTAAYAMPETTGACAGAAAPQTVSFTIGDAAGDGFPWLWVIVGVAVLLAVVAVVVILARRRKTPVAAALLLVVALGMFLSQGKPALADVTVDPTSGVPVPGVDFQKAVDGCMAGFAAPGGDPSGILPRLQDKKTPQVRIIPTTGGSGAFETPEGPAGKGSSTVTWNPTSTEDYGDGVLRDPCAALYHELNHADDISRDKVPQGDCGDTGIRTAEVKATMAENKYRVAKGLPPRTEYQGKKLPKSMDDCKKPKKKDPPKKGPVKLCEGTPGQCGATNGDPHLVTFDGAYYDLQAVGEFIAVKSTSGAALEVQARQAPMGTSRSVSVNSALAFRIGTGKVELALVNNSTELRLDGALKAIAPGEMALPGGGTLTRRDSDISASDGYDLEWPDGSGAAVDPIGHYGYRLLIKLASGRAGAVQGILGNFDGDPANDIAPAGGTPLTQPVPFEKLYPSYADSWRVKQNESLFTYASGQNTDTFTDRAYPEKPMTIDNIDPARRAQAEAICRSAGITETWQFLECVFDVALSGRPEFALGTASTARIAQHAVTPISAAPVAAGTVKPGESLTFTGKAGQAVFVDAFAPTVRNDCSPYKLLDPSGKQLNSGCNINGSGYIDRTELTVDGQYKVTLDSANVTSGQASLRVYAAKDIAATIEPNGAEVFADLDRPGSVARYTFTGVAGQRVFLDVPDSTLPHQCSPLELRDPTGRQIESGCIINGNGEIEGTLLTVNGTYTITFDPREGAIGNVHMRLYAANDVTGPISANGQSVTATIKQPGFVSRHEFTGTPGMSLTIEATDSTLPDQCSPIKLLDPSGKYVDSGCVINGKGGIDSVTLAAAGTYTLVVDPAGAATGVVTLTMRQR